MGNQEIPKREKLLLLIIAFIYGGALFDLALSYRSLLAKAVIIAFGLYFIGVMAYIYYSFRKNS